MILHANRGALCETYRDCSIGRGLTGANCHRVSSSLENSAEVTCTHIGLPRRLQKSVCRFAEPDPAVIHGFELLCG
jgi:hypothetical protein